MSDVLSRILAGALGGGTQGATPRPPADEAGRRGGAGGPPPMQQQASLAAGEQASAPESGLGGLLRGLLGSAPGDGEGAAGVTIAGVREVAVTAVLAWLMRGRGGAQGLSALVAQLRDAGLGDQVDSWIAPGANRDLRPEELARAIPPEALDEVEAHTGIAREEVLTELAHGLPAMVDRLSPQGRLPERDAELDAADEAEIRRALGLAPPP
jgi:uncharacterized protein YidB (DUF937 family)